MLLNKSTMLLLGDLSRCNEKKIFKRRLAGLALFESGKHFQYSHWPSFTHAQIVNLKPLFTIVNSFLNRYKAIILHQRTISLSPKHSNIALSYNMVRINRKLLLRLKRNQLSNPILNSCTPSPMLYVKGSMYMTNHFIFLSVNWKLLLSEK